LSRPCFVAVALGVKGERRLDAAVVEQLWTISGSALCSAANLEASGGDFQLADMTVLRSANPLIVDQ